MNPIGSFADLRINWSKAKHCEITTLKVSIILNKLDLDNICLKRFVYRRTSLIQLTSGSEVFQEKVAKYSFIRNIWRAGGFKALHITDKWRILALLSLLRNNYELLLFTTDIHFHIHYIFYSFSFLFLFDVSMLIDHYKY